LFLLDTVVLSELRRRPRNPGVSAWFLSVREADVFVSSVTFGEIEMGIEKQRSLNPAFAAELTRWVGVTRRTYASRIISFDVPIAQRWGRLASQIGHKGLDLAIAATALEHGLTVVTRNVAHFRPTGAPLLNPFI
jgi:predicted nucleic acid-binding protein